MTKRAGRTRELALVPLLACLGVARADVAIVHCDQGPAIKRVADRHSVVLAVESSAGPGAWLRIEESGHDFDYTTDGGATWRPVGVRPPRLGIDYISVRGGDRIGLRRSNPTAAAAHLRYQLICASDQETAADAACTGRARHVEATGEVAMAPDPAASSLCAALFQHAGATWSSRQNRPQESIERYIAAIAAWARRGDASREAAAWLGRAEQHWRLADYPAAIDAATRAESLATAARQPYFATRARMERCLALDALGDGAKVDACFDGVAERFVVLAELNDAVTVLVSRASIALERGDALLAEKHVAAALRIDPTRLSNLTTGRLRLVDAQVAVQRGRFDWALVAIDASLTAFEAARDRRGQANAQLYAASILFALDAADDAAELAAQAYATYVAIDAHARAAAARSLLARIAQANGDAGTAIAHASRAAALHREQGAPWRALDATLVAVTVGDADAGATVEAALGDADMPKRLRKRAQLALAEAALARGDDARTRTLLADLEDALLDPVQAHRRALTEAALATREGRPAHAIAVIDAAIDRVHRLAAVLPSASLRFALGTQLGELRAAWVDAWVAWPGELRPDVSVVWRMQVRTGREALLSRMHDARNLPADALARFEAITARAMVPTDEDSADVSGGQRALLAYQAALGRPAGHAQGDWLTLATLQAALAEGDCVLALATGSSAALRLIITRDHASVSALPWSPAVRDEIAALGAMLVQPSSPLAVIDAKARRVSDWLFSGLATARPARLLVHADALRVAGALGLFKWPGDVAILAESARVSWLATGRRGRAPGPLRTELDVFVASAVVDSGAARALAELANADVEAAWISAALGDAAVSARAGGDFTRDALAAALAREGARVHIATHGRTRRGLLGQSGLLLPRAQSGELDFVSWIGLADQPIRADLLVLNACDLADGPGSGTVRQTAFANALAASGARDIVAALWPVSDGAAAVWVPAFYRALAAAPDDPAHALQSAQAALRASRMYRHPHYWTAIVHLTTVSPASGTPRL